MCILCSRKYVHSSYNGKDSNNRTLHLQNIIGIHSAACAKNYAESLKFTAALLISKNFDEKLQTDHSDSTDSSNCRGNVKNCQLFSPSLDKSNTFLTLLDLKTKNNSYNNGRSPISPDLNSIELRSISKKKTKKRWTISTARTKRLFTTTDFINY